MNPEAVIRIGEVARRAGVGIDTVRFYERRGLIAPASRARSGYRSFAPSVVDRIGFVKSCQDLGFTLDEIVDILRGIDRGETNYARGQKRLERVLRRVDEKIAHLKEMRASLRALLADFKRGTSRPMERIAKRIRQSPRVASKR